MKIKAGYWRQLGLIQKANLLIFETNNNRIAYNLRKQKNKPLHRHV